MTAPLSWVLFCTIDHPDALYLGEVSDEIEAVRLVDEHVIANNAGHLPFVFMHPKPAAWCAEHVEMHDNWTETTYIRHHWTVGELEECGFDLTRTIHAGAA